MLKAGCARKPIRTDLQVLFAEENRQWLDDRFKGSDTRAYEDMLRSASAHNRWQGVKSPQVAENSGSTLKSRR